MQRRELEIQAPDGRRLRVQVAGQESDPLVVFNAGTPGMRHLYEGHVKEGLARGLRHACCSRPGYGGSDRQAGRLIADCVADVAAVADELGAETFYVVGHSGGGGHALACAALLPDRVLSIASLGTFAPRFAEGLDWWAGFKEWNREEFEAAETGDAQLKQFIEEAAVKMREIKNEATLLDLFGEFYSEADLSCLTGAFLEYQLIGCGQAIGGDNWGWFDDDLAFCNDWGFVLSQVTVPAAIWHGTDDWVTPISHGEWLSRQVPNCRFHPLAGEGHSSPARAALRRSAR